MSAKLLNAWKIVANWREFDSCNPKGKFIYNNNSFIFVFKAPAKRSQHFKATYRNIVGRAFGRPVATCWVYLAQIWNWPNFFQAAFVNVAWCCGRLARFVQQCYPWARTLVRFSIPNMSQHNTLHQGGQTCHVTFLLGNSENWWWISILLIQ